MKTLARHSRTSSVVVPVLFVLLTAEVGFLAASSDHTSGLSYEFLSLEYPNARGTLGFSTLIDINDRGEIIGGFAAGEAQGLLIGTHLTISRIGCPNATYTALLDINNSGAIAGSCSDRTANHAFWRSRSGKFILIDVPGALTTAGRGLNDLNQIVGYFRGNAVGHHGFVWDRGTITVFDLPGLHSVIPYPHGINNRGQIVGAYAEFPCNCNSRGFLLSEGTLIGIDVPGATATIPNGINDDGVIVGTYVDSEARHHGFVFTHGEFITLDVPFAGIDFTEANRINNLGQIVGRYLTAEPGYNIGFLAVPKPGPKSRSQDAR